MRLLPLLALLTVVGVGSLAGQDKPNVILILADDLGYGDLGCYGSPSIRTPNLDRLAASGVKMTNFYANPNCSPSRAALLTGRYPEIVGIPVVLGPPGLPWTSHCQFGLDPETTTTIAEVMRDKGYATGMVGKWHLGHYPETMPRKHGFDYFYGLPYSNDMRPEGGKGYPDLNLYRNEEIIVVNPDQTNLTASMYEEALGFIDNHREEPFFLYLAHPLPHVPLYASEPFRGRSGQGLLADVVEEVDAGIGDLVARLATYGLAQNTIIIFTSDNGPWISYGNHAGSPGPFRGSKSTTFEGGVRVPFIVNWPAKIPPGGVSHQVASLMDILPTLGAPEVSGASPKAPPETDGENILPNWLQPQGEREKPVFTWFSEELQTVRRGRWKLHLPHAYAYLKEAGQDGVRTKYLTDSISLSLFDVVADPGERYDRNSEHPELVAELQRIMEEHAARVAREKQEPWRPKSD